VTKKKETAAEKRERIAAEKRKQKEMEIVEKDMVARGKPRGRKGRPPQLYEGNLSAKAGDIRRIGQNLLYWYNKPKAKTDDEIQERLLEFFERCITNGEVMTVEKMALALGYDRKTLWAWETGGEGSTPTRRNLVKKAKELLASYDAEMVAEGKLNPVTYIFRAKNYFGMRDQVEHVVTPNNPLGDEASPDEIRRRLAGGDVETIDV
jgi:hypothetical protein